MSKEAAPVGEEQNTELQLCKLSVTGESARINSIGNVALNEG